MRFAVRILLVLGVVVGSLIGFFYFRAQQQHEAEDVNLATLKKTITVSSNSFPPDGDVPVICTCRGSELSPALVWEGKPRNAASYVILVTDSDAPAPNFPLFTVAHWVVYNLPASVRSLPEGVTVEQMRMLGGKIGKNSRGNATYTGPCPPFGRHTYVFRVYAIDRQLALSGLPDKQDVLNAMQGHVLGYGELKGYFQ